MDRNNLAHAYAQALPISVVSLEELVAWADGIILEEDEPAIEFIELAASQKESDALTQLKEISKGSDEETSMRFLFGLCYDALKNGGANYSAVARRLYFWSMYETSLEGFGELGSFWNEIDLAYEGVYGDPAEIEKRMLQFLNENKA